MENQQNNRWNATLHARPFAEQLADYKEDTISKAFPLHFPYGHSGLEGDPSLELMEKLPKNSKYMKRSRLGVLRKFLQHSNPIFHGPRFNLIVENLILKEQIFQSTRMYCTTKHADGSYMADKYGTMNWKALEKAIYAARQDHGSRHSSKAENRYLKSINAACECLPHSNEAAQVARRQYFSFLIKFGLPAIFLTITPDDKRNFRIILYACGNHNHIISPYAKDYVNSLSDDDIFAKFKVRERVREQHPGLCAEEYNRIMKLVIKHLFDWDEEKQCSTGNGLFGELLAWCLATEEQGRKTLHGHFLLFLKGWEEVLETLQNVGTTGYTNAIKEAKALFKNSCSAELFEDLQRGKVLNEQPIFYHPFCRSERSKKRKFFTPKYVGDEIFREMRHKAKCNLHLGHIATCMVCNTKLTVQTIVENALRLHLGKHGDKVIPFNFPKVENKRLDMHVYEMQKDFLWMTGDEKTLAKRYFASNALSNFHLPWHTSRCFKKGSECFANLPEQPFEETKIQYSDEMFLSSDGCGNRKKIGIFRFYPKRNLEDAFMNVHNKWITIMLGCNNNVSAGLNGSSVFYCTGYNTKSQQKEEREAFERISQVIVKILQDQDENNILDELTPCQLGFRRMLAGIYTHTNSHILAAPMAHYLALHHSRFHYSHDSDYVPVHGIENLLLNMPMVMRFRICEGKQIPVHKAMDYIYRPTQLELMTPITFFSKIECISLSFAKKLNIEFFKFEEKHPLAKAYVCKYRERDVVPVFPWNWLPNTRMLSKSFYDSPSLPHHCDFSSREKHALCFLIMFSSFRTKKEICSEGSYQKTLQKKLAEGLIDKEMLRTADRIQNIYNSLDSGQCENILTMNSHSPDADDVEEKDEGQLDSFDDMLANIGAYMASSSEQQPLAEEAVDLTPQYMNRTRKYFDNFISQTDVTESPLTDVFHIGANNTKKAGEKNGSESQTTRFTSKTSQLNTFFTSTFCRSNTEYNQSTQNDKKKKKYIITPNGTWESIVAWARNAELDREQEVAFQILAATYVLTFMEEAEEDCSGEARLSFEKNKKRLQLLARRRENKTGPIRLFITGPAGAGKCK